LDVAQAGEFLPPRLRFQECHRAAPPAVGMHFNRLQERAIFVGRQLPVDQPVERSGRQFAV